MLAVNSVTALIALSVCAATVYGDCRADVLFVVDASASVKHGFERQVEFVARIGQLLHIAPGLHRAALVEYSGANRVVKQFGFDNFQSTDEFITTVRALPHMAGTTFTGKALQHALLILQGRRPDAKTLLITVTDGFSYDPVAPMMEQILDLGPQIQTFAVGVNHPVQIAELVELAGGKVQNVFIEPGAQQVARVALGNQLRCSADKILSATSVSRAKFQLPTSARPFPLPTLATTSSTTTRVTTANHATTSAAAELTTVAKELSTREQEQMTTEQLRTTEGKLTKPSPPPERLQLVETKVETETRTPVIVRRPVENSGSAVHSSRTGCSLDLAIIVDSSGRQRDLFEEYKYLASQLLERLIVGENHTRVAMVSYAESGSILSHMRQRHPLDRLLLSLRDARFITGHTDTRRALESALREFSETMGARPRGQVAQVALVFTNGFSCTGPAEAARALRGRGVEVRAVALGMGGRAAIDLDELVAVAGSLDGVINGDSFGSFVDSFVREFCPANARRKAVFGAASTPADRSAAAAAPFAAA